MFPNKENSTCEECGVIISNCTVCQNKSSDREQLKCSQCQEGFHVSDDDYSCVEDSSDSSAAEMVAIVAGGIAVVGLGKICLM